MWDVLCPWPQLLVVWLASRRAEGEGEVEALFTQSVPVLMLLLEPIYVPPEAPGIGGGGGGGGGGGAGMLTP